MFQALFTNNGAVIAANIYSISMLHYFFDNPFIASFYCII